MLKHSPIYKIKEHMIESDKESKNCWHVPLIPGSSLYYAMSAIVAFNAVQTVLVAGAIAFGILLFFIF